MASRLSRQENAFPTRDRASSALLSVCSDRNRDLARARVIGAACMGIPVLGGDDPAYESPGAHWLHAAYPFLVAEFDPEATWAFLDPIAPEIAVPPEFREAANPWIAVDASDPDAAIASLERLARSRTRVLVTVVGPGGLLVIRCPSPADAVDVLRPLAGSDSVPCGPTCLAVAAAGIELNEVMLGPYPAGDDLALVRTVAFYSQHRPRRADLKESETAAELVAEISRPAEGAVSPVSGRQVVVGAGALGNWFFVSRILEGAPSTGPIEIWDDDRAELSNLNRQPLLARIGLGRSKAAVVVEELRIADPDGEYKELVRRVASPRDLAGAAALFVATPDNDEARLVVADAARASGALYGTAGTSGIGAQIIVVQGGRACLACVLPPGSGNIGRADSCHLVRDDAVSCTNMIAAGLLQAELGRSRSSNLRFTGRGGGASRIARMLSDPNCPHRVGELTRV